MIVRLSFNVISYIILACTVPELSFKFTNSDSNTLYDPSNDPEKSLVISMNLVGGDCLLSFESTKMVSSDNVMII